MTSVLNLSRRHIVPLWLPSRFGSRPETQSLPNPGILESRSSLLTKKLVELSRRFLCSSSSSDAEDLVTSAFFHPDQTARQRAIRLVQQSDLPKNRIQAISAAAESLDIEARIELASSINLADPKRSVRELRRRLRLSPRLANAWSDMALAYTILDLEEKAYGSMNVALQLAPSSRTILRNAVRMYVHFGDVTRALWLVRKSEGLRGDPWLQSCEISCSQLSGKRSLYLGKAERGLQSTQPGPVFLSELYGAVGDSLAEKNRKRGIRFLRNSIVTPSYNTESQVRWHIHQGSLPENTSIPSVRSNFEADFYQRLQQREFSEAVQSALKWADFEPYSARPYRYGIWICITTLFDLELAQSLLSDALLKRPNDVNFLNEQVLVYAYLGELERAVAVFNRLSIERMSDDEKALVTATLGLLCFRTGSIELARKLYWASRRRFQKTRDRGAEATCLVYWSLEEARQGHRGRAERMLGEAERLCPKTLYPELEPMIARCRSVRPCLAGQGQCRKIPELERLQRDLEVNVE